MGKRVWNGERESAASLPTFANAVRGGSLMKIMRHDFDDYRQDEMIIGGKSEEVESSI